MTRKIIHIDMDAFFASVEQRDNPELRGKAIAIGGQPEKRGVVATASYEARKFGIKSAMPMATAVKLCPDLMIVRPRISYYREISEQIREIFSRFTQYIEPLSIDEAYLDVSKSEDFQGSATLLAQHILQTIHEETQLTASAGVSYCKFLAKYASNINKPNGVFTITPAQALEIIGKIPVEKFHGIGPATQKKLNQMGIFTGKDLRHSDLRELQKRLGKSANFFHDLANGKDNREIRIDRIRKSIGNETTFSKDISDYQQLWQQLEILLEQSWQSLMKKNLFASTITIKIKYHDFTLRTKSYTQSSPIISLASASIITESLLKQQTLTKPVRLIGITFSHLSSKYRTPIQLRLFD